eukprot:SAG31_NODE_2810_length_5061_cov_12.226522_1_plen_188_part_00
MSPPASRLVHVQAPRMLAAYRASATGAALRAGWASPRILAAHPHQGASACASQVWRRLASQMPHHQPSNGSEGRAGDAKPWTAPTVGDGAARYQGHNFPELLESWSRSTFRQCGAALGLAAAGSTVAAMNGAFWWTLVVPFDACVATYWIIGLRDMRSKTHAIKRNFPVLGNIRYLLESIRPGEYAR